MTKNRIQNFHISKIGRKKKESQKYHDPNIVKEKKQKRSMGKVV